MVKPGIRAHTDRYGVAGSVACQPIMAPVIAVRSSDSASGDRKCRLASRARRSSTVNERTDSGFVLFVHRGANLLELVVGGTLSRFVLLLGAAALGGFGVQFR